MDLVLRAIAAFLIILVFTRVLGKRELSSMQPFDLIVLVIIGDLVQQGVTQNDMSVTGVLIVLATLGTIQVLVSYLSYRFRGLRTVLDGKPLLVVEHGKLIKANLKRERLTDDDLLEQARQNGIDSLEQVKWAILETNGQISFIKKQS